MNATSEVRLRALGEELGLSELELKLALDTLDRSRTAGPKLTRRQRRQHDRFCERVREALGKMPHEILPTTQRDAWIEWGKAKFGLSEDLAEESVDQLATQRGLRFVSQAVAVEHLTRRAKKRLDVSSVIDDRVLKKIYAEGHKWGLTNDDVSAVLAGHARTESRHQWLDRAVLAVAVLAVLAVAGLFYTLLVSGGSNEESPDSGADDLIQGSAPSAQDMSGRNLMPTIGKLAASAPAQPHWATAPRRCGNCRH